MLWTKVTGGAADWPLSDDKVVFAVRLPRVAAAALVGAALAVSGAAYQGMFRNPMVSPDILGASTGAGFGAAVAILLGAGYFGISAAACWRWRWPGSSAVFHGRRPRWPWCWRA